MLKSFRCSINFDYNWVLSKRNDDVLPIERVLTAIKTKYNIESIDTDLTGCVFDVDAGDNITKDAVFSDILALIRTMYEDSYSEKVCNINIEVNEKQEKVEPIPAVEDKNSGKTNDSKHTPENKSKKFQNSVSNNPSAVEMINNLVGADEFKALANECVRLAPHLKESDTLDAFLRRKYIISINDGCGLTEYLNLFGKLLSELDLFKCDEATPVREVKLLSDSGTKNENDSFSVVLSSIETKSRSRIICVDISEWMTQTTDKRFRDFLKAVEANAEQNIVFFRIPFVETNILSEVKSSINDFLFVKELSIVPFTMEQLCEGAERILKNRNFTIDEQAMEIFKKRIIEEKSDGKFYGMNTVNKVISELLYMKQCYNADNDIFDKDIKAPQIGRLSLTGSEKYVSAIDKLNSLTGMEKIKQRIIEIVSQIEASLHNEELDTPCIHMRFVGNPGTGKTTVARILGEILKEKGILRNGNFFEYGGRDFCGRYVGETAPKTAAMCRDAYGSVLFIDEAYSLYRDDSSHDYGREAIDTLIAEMENHRSDFMVIMAGYPYEMDYLMKANPGLKSRMPYQIEFPNYTREELYAMFISLTEKSFIIDEELKSAVHKYFEELDEYLIQSKEFSNARFVRNLYERTWGKAVLRTQLSGEKCEKLMVEDFILASSESEFQTNTQVKATRIGFN